MPAFYLEKVLSTKIRKEIVKEVKQVLKTSRIKFDGIAFTGVSGMLLGMSLADAMNKSVVVVRKKYDGSYSSHNIESLALENIKNYIIVDDFVESGETIQRIIDLVHFKGCVGIVCYSSMTKKRATKIKNVLGKVLVIGPNRYGMYKTWK